MPPRNFYAILLTFLISQRCYVEAERNRAAAPVADSMHYIDRYYVDEVDQQELLEGAMLGLTEKLDPYSQFFPPGLYEQFQDSIEQEFAGIGAVVEQPDRAAPTRIITPLVGSPALAAGLLPGDQIIGVGDTPTAEMPLPEVVELLRGPIGSTVEVRVRRSPPNPTTGADSTTGANPMAGTEEAAGASETTGASEELVFRVTRGNIQLESVLGDHRDAENRWVYRLSEDPQIAYIRLTTFGERTTAELRQTLEELDNRFGGMILDLRGNAGGLLTSAVDICDMFLEEGRIVSTRGRGVLKSAPADAAAFENAAWDASAGTLVDPRKPLVVLIDGNSASAAEIVAACLKDHGRAILVGERTFGKGSVQNLFPLENGRSALKLTTARFYRPNGQTIHRGPDASEADQWGVQPTAGYAVPLDDETRRRALRRWELATYPHFAASVPVPEGSSKALAEVDPQLWRAIETLHGKGPTPASQNSATQNSEPEDSEPEDGEPENSEPENSEPENSEPTGE
ncbi:S41 family peptidase [Candidatus Laterigemmans baculatus]|uniref:S41 family peptidase n=1 Tax=Candidatus Laterigemmans baculatus TaxID=2770505 RepID=UPI0013DAB208|nr:S41 family peptidase [Candidatus Laterigemmans baculatus]